MPGDNESKKDLRSGRLALNRRQRKVTSKSEILKGGPSEYLDFLPAALQIMESPPSPHGRILGWSLITLFALAIIWACIGQINIVAVADGKIISSSRIKDIQPLEKGVVKAVYVKEGQTVQQGDPLVELDRTRTQAEQTRISQELRFARLNATRRQKLLEALDLAQSQVRTNSPLSSENTVAIADADGQRKVGELTTQEQLLQQEWLEYQARLATLKSQRAERSATLESTLAQVKQLQQTLPLITRRTQAMKRLVDRQLAPEMDYLTLEQQRIEQRQTLASLKARQQQHKAAIATLDQQLNSLQAETRSRWLTQLDEFTRQRQNLIQELAKARDQNARQVLYAPVSGRVQQLAVNTIGGVVTEAQILMQLVPDNDFLEVEAILENKDIGFVFEGQNAEVKVNTFNFTKYGVIDARVIDVTADAVVDEVKGLVYKLRLQLDRSEMQIGNRLVDLMPGMSVTAEVDTGKRRLIEFVLSPLMRKVDESVRER